MKIKSEYFTGQRVDAERRLPGIQKTFGERLAERGFIRIRVTSGMVYQGVGLIEVDE